MSKIRFSIVSLSLLPDDMNMSIASGDGLIFPIRSRDFHGRNVPRSYSGVPSLMNVKNTGWASFTPSQNSVSSQIWTFRTFFTPAII